MLSSILFLFSPSIPHHFSCKDIKAEISNLYEAKLMHGFSMTFNIILKTFHS